MGSPNQPWQQQGPYGAQPPGYPPYQQPYQQQGYPPQFGAPPPPPRKRGPWPWLVPLIVVVVAAAVVVPIVLTRGGGSAGTPTASGPATSAAKPWIVTAGQTGVYPDGFGAWTNGANLITVNTSTVTAYQRGDGSKVWSLTPPTQGMSFCGASRNVAGDRLAVAYGVLSQDDKSNQVCTNLGLVDLATGKFVWSEQYLQDSASPPASAVMVIVGNDLFAGFNLSNLVSQIDLTTGKTKTHDIMSDTDSADCSINDITATSSSVYYLATCQPGLPSDPNAPLDTAQFDGIRAENADTGQQTAFGEITAQSAQLPTGSTLGVEPGTFISASPMIVQTSADDADSHTTGAFVGVDDALHVSWSITGQLGDPNSLDTLSAGDSSAGYTGFGRAFVSNGVLLAETTYQNPNGLQNNKIVAVDAKTGQVRWRTGGPKLSLAAPVAVHGSTVLAVGMSRDYDPGSGRPPTVLAHVDLNTGALTSTTKFDLPVTGTNLSLASAQSFQNTWFVAADDRVYGVATGNGATTPPTQPEVFAIG